MNRRSRSRTLDPYGAPYVFPRTADAAARGGLDPVVEPPAAGAFARYGCVQQPVEPVNWTINWTINWTGAR